MVLQVGHEFGDVNIEKGTYGPILTFDNNDYGQAFAEANPEFVLEADLPQTELDQYLVDSETRAEKIARWLRAAFRFH
jgi:hypothetical protein